MENTIKEKNKFFAQYWGQEIMKEFEGDLKETVYMANPHANQSNISKYYLELKPISSITDEEIEQLRKDLDFDINAFDNQSRAKDWLQSFSFNTLLGGQNLLIPFHYWLIENGFAVPLPKLSVEKQIEFGWIKLATAGRSY